MRFWNGLPHRRNATGGENDGYRIPWEAAAAVSLY